MLPSTIANHTVTRNACGEVEAGCAGCVASGRWFILYLVSPYGDRLSSKPYFSKQRLQYPESGCLEQRKCTRVLQTSQSLKSRSGVPTIAMMKAPPSAASLSKTLNPPCVGISQTEQTSPDSWSCMVVVTLAVRLQSPIPLSHDHTSREPRPMRSLRFQEARNSSIFRSMSLLGAPHRLRLSTITARAGGSPPSFFTLAFASMTPEDNGSPFRT